MIRATHIFIPVLIVVILVAGVGYIGGTIYKKNRCDATARAATDGFFSQYPDADVKRKEKAFDDFYKVCDEVNIVYFILAEYDKKLIYGKAE